MSKQNDGAKKRISIVGTVTAGKSGEGWWSGRYTGSETVLSQLGTEGDIEIYINSPGGSVFAGFEILNALNAASKAGRKIDIYVASMAASIASYISTGVKNAVVHMSENAKLMFHAPWSIVIGSREQLDDVSSLLGKMEEDLARAILQRGAKFDKDWFAAGRAKWLNAKEAIAAKLADDIADPPQDLIAAIAAKQIPSTTMSYREYDDSAEGKAKRRATMQLPEQDRFVANMSFEALLRTMCSERYGEEVSIEMLEEGSFRATTTTGNESLLKYRPDSLNIVAIEWDTEVVLSQNEEPKMKTQPKSEQPPAAEPKSEQPPAAEPKSEQPPAAEPKSEQPPATEPKSEQLPNGMTQDMVDFALANYKPAREGHLAAIKACKENTFTDAELEEFPIAKLSKLAALASKPAAADTKPPADKSLIAPAPAAKGTVGTLPPPEL